MLARVWWNGAEVCQGGLRFPRVGPGRSAELRITEAGVAIDFEGASAEFPWTEPSHKRVLETSALVTDLPLTHRNAVAEVSFRRLSSFGRGGGGGGGGGGGAGGGVSAVAVAAIIAVFFAVYITLTGGVALVVDPQGAGRAARAASRANFGKRFGGVEGQPLIPLWAPRFGGLRGRSEADTLTALCDALSLRPELRTRLADPRRAEQLIRDLQAWSGRLVKHRAGLRRRRFETMAAAAKLGYVHQNGGRPLPDKILDPLDDVVEAVIASISRNPYSKYLLMDRNRVAAILDKHYVSITEWPFTALTAQQS
jgi:hypothetical protein